MFSLFTCLTAFLGQIITMMRLTIWIHITVQTFGKQKKMVEDPRFPRGAVSQYFLFFFEYPMKRTFWSSSTNKFNVKVWKSKILKLELLYKICYPTSYQDWVFSADSTHCNTVGYVFDHNRFLDHCSRSPYTMPPYQYSLWKNFYFYFCTYM